MQNNQQNQYFSDNNGQLPAWKEMEQIVRKWVVMNQHAKVLENYEELRKASLSQ